jgi:hypothetical protein
VLVVGVAFVFVLSSMNERFWRLWFQLVVLFICRQGADQVEFLCPYSALGDATDPPRGVSLCMGLSTVPGGCAHNEGRLKKEPLPPTMPGAMNSWEGLYDELYGECGVVNDGGSGAGQHLWWKEAGPNSDPKGADRGWGGRDSLFPLPLPPLLVQTSKGDRGRGKGKGRGKGTIPYNPSTTWRASPPRPTSPDTPPLSSDAV